MPDLGLRNQLEHRLDHSQPGPQDRHQADPLGEPAAVGRRERRLDRRPAPSAGPWSPRTPRATPADDQFAETPAAASTCRAAASGGSAINGCWTSNTPLIIRLRRSSAAPRLGHHGDGHGFILSPRTTLPTRFELWRGRGSRRADDREAWLSRSFALPCRAALILAPAVRPEKNRTAAVASIFSDSGGRPAEFRRRYNEP